MTEILWLSILWVVAASVLGFAVSAIFSAGFRLSRRVFLFPYVILVGAFLFAYALWGEVDVKALLVDNWVAGLVAGVLVSMFLVRSVRSQPESRQSRGGELILDLAWAGLVYGLTDALFLNVMPVLAVWHGFAGIEWAETALGRIAVGGLALMASLLVTLTYHLGYREFRDRKVGLVLFGNGLISLAFLLSGNPLGALIGHTVMHLAAVVQGPETTIQLPPHLVPQE
ncbi:MAG: hypothetical protein PVH65_03175 [Chloroflexota bacterium]|jgi:hypothetical protein